MKSIFAKTFALIGWFAIIAQFYLMMQNRTSSVAETTIRFFSFFTILTNLLCAIYFSTLSFTSHNPASRVKSPGVLTAITVFITVVGLVYQVILRQLWHPTGLQRIVDELLHTIIPLLVILFWHMYETKKALQYRQLLKWLLYPLFYLAYILIRGHFSGFYPYPFVDVSKLGFGTVVVNSCLMTALFLVVSVLYIFMGKKLYRERIEGRG